MFKRALNRAVIRLHFETRAPLLIRAGDTGLNPARADLSCVRTRHATLGTTVYVPGSSVKGVIRSAAEALIRRDEHGRTAKYACDPLDHSASCGGHWSKKKDAKTEVVYSGHCLACRLFGSTALRCRCAIRDLFPFLPHESEPSENFKTANRVETRNGVGIDRIAGSVRVGPFDLEMVPVGVRFHGEIALTNIQAWQLGLLAAALRELNEGFVQLGSTKSRGLGVVSVGIDEILFEQVRSSGARPVGVGAIVTKHEREAYGLLRELELPAASGVLRGLSRRFTLTGREATEWLQATENALEAVA